MLTYAVNNNRELKMIRIFFFLLRSELDEEQEGGGGETDRASDKKGSSSTRGLINSGLRLFRPTKT